MPLLEKLKHIRQSNLTSHHFDDPVMPALDAWIGFPHYPLDLQECARVSGI